MKTSAFISYIGASELHNGYIRRVSRKADAVHVRVRGASGEDYDLAFAGVRGLRSNRPNGKELYAVSEMLGRAPGRKFLFDSWDEDGRAALEIDAERVKISKVMPRGSSLAQV